MPAIKLNTFIHRMPFLCTISVDGKPCRQRFENRRKLKEHLVPAPHSAMKVVCPFCLKRENTFSRPADLKNHVSKRHRDSTLSIAVPLDDLLSEKNAFWVSCQPSLYRSLVEPTDRNSRQSSRLRALLLDWTKKITFPPKRSRQEWLDGWELPPMDFQEPDQYDPSSPGMYKVDFISLVPSAITATLSDENTLFLLELEDQVLFDSRSISSLSRKMAVQTKPAQLGVNYQIQDLDKNRNHLASSLGIAPHFIRKISSAQKPMLCTALEPEIELFAESDIDSPVSSTRGIGSISLGTSITYIYVHVVSPSSSCQCWTHDDLCSAQVSP
jgi:hypothetical protein